MVGRVILSTTVCRAWYTAAWVSKHAYFESLSRDVCYFSHCSGFAPPSPRNGSREPQDPEQGNVEFPYTATPMQKALREDLCAAA